MQSDVNIRRMFVRLILLSVVNRGSVWPVGARQRTSVALLGWRSGGWGWINTESWVRAAGGVERESWGRLYRTGCIPEGHTGIIKPTNPGEGGVWQGKLMTLRTCHGKWPRCHSDKNNTQTQRVLLLDYLLILMMAFLVPEVSCVEFCSLLIQNCSRSTPAGSSDREIYGRSQGKLCKITGAGQVWHLYNLWGRLSKPLISLGEPISHLRAISPSRRKSNIF